MRYLHGRGTIISIHGNDFDTIPLKFNHHFFSKLPGT
jgi:hypothetical protein